MSWECPGCNQHTADGQKHWCITEEYEALEKENAALQEQLDNKHGAMSLEIHRLMRENAALREKVAGLEQRIEKLHVALQGLLLDTQHSEHSCGDKHCPVEYAREALKADDKARGE